MKWVFWVGILVIGYSYAGYPMWLWIRKRMAPRPVRRGRLEPTVSVAMVVRNEEAVIERKLQNLLTLDYPAGKLEVVVVSDGSDDQTNIILGVAAAADRRVRTLLKPASQGKAAGLNDAISAASGEVVLFTDARQMIEAGALRFLVENFADSDVGCASGELLLGDPQNGESSKGMGVYWRVEKQIREMESASGSVVGATGAIYAARKALLSPLFQGLILDDVMLPMQIVSRGSRVVFDARARAWDEPDLGKAREFARKVRTLSGNYQLLQAAPWLLSSRNPIRFEFISHKLSRLVVPFALLAVLVASAFLPEPFYRAILVLQIAFYGLSLIAIAGFKIGPLSRLADPARTFVVLNSAAMVAFVNFLSGRKAVWSR